MSAKRKSLPCHPISVRQVLTRVYRFKPDVKLRFITEELGFMSDEEAGQFIVNHNAQDLLVERGNDLYFLTGKGLGFFEAAKASAFGRVDIKGQI